MDAAFFRFLGPELAHALSGVRFDSAFCPAPGFWTLPFSPPVSANPERDIADCRFLLLRVHSQRGALFLSSVKPANPAIPPVKAMWLRKRLRGRRVIGSALDWRRRRLALELSPGEGRFLLLALEDDPALAAELPADFGVQGAWGNALALQADPDAPRSLRRALEREEPEDRDAFLHTFLEGVARGFFLGDSMPTPSPLPWPPGRESRRFPTALEAAREYGDGAYFSELIPPDEGPKKAELRRAKRSAHLDGDQRRLEALVLQHRFGEAIAANLSGLDSREKIKRLELDHPELGPMAIPVDPSLTIMQNMERFFRKAAKGRRGLGHVARLREELAAERSAPNLTGQVGRAGHAIQAGQAKQTGQAALLGQAAKAVKSSRAVQAAGVRQREKNGRSGKGAPPALNRYRTSDGFLVLRGKNGAANHRLLSELASPFDYWFHAKDCPGAHVVLKRDSPGHQVPERSLEEAAILAALASGQAGEAKASVLCTQVREVRTIKGAPLGQVRLDSAAILTVSVDPGLEERLKLS